jgi:endonuclease YncB( thermonuclease family)
MRFCHAALAVAALMAPCAPAAGRDLPASWRETAPGLAVAAASGDTLVLATGETVRLAGILAPRAEDGAAGKRWAAWAEAQLAELAAGKAIRLFVAGPEDRRGRLVAFARIGDGDWLQEAMLRRGAARVYFQIGRIARAREALAAEALARGERRGLWIDPAYAVRRHDALGAGEGGYAIVEGTIRNAALAGDTLYLNFDRDFRRDFTVGLDRAAQRRFKAAKIDALEWAGKTVRVRGWIERRGGPYIGAAVPEQIELLD